MTDATVGVERFKVIVYVCTAANADPSLPHQECIEHAEMYGWDVAATIADDTGLSAPQERTGLAEAIERIKAKEAGAILTAYRSMISPRQDEYDQIAAEVEEAGGFLAVRDRERQIAVPMGRSPERESRSPKA
ncbi:MULTISPECIES: hypothetical protein [Streptomyces violaceusniger group]|uniref:Resolvase/invertase-type recombinase catalytic domain-containing protein n=2 Tax=Streptomyces violaceusniger group TaxID=2839105 RepID=A0A7X5X5L5_STRMQ|nr:MULTISPECIES: hypothetical protein [Streptomyces violaceusniger group]MBP2065802.1 hypothetical protein [Streptomyces iranensis]NIY67002.1 hypothetical protein [Streptomyces malaysiensis]CDR08180.1 predicted protein [Streptomyces iranensis]